MGFLRILAFVSGVLAVLLGIGFLLQLPLVMQLWPWQMSFLSALFIASIFAAIAAPVIWVAVKNEIAASFGGAVNLGVMFAGMGIFCLQLYFIDNTRQPILYFGIFSLVSALFLAGLAWQTRGMAFLDNRPTPKMVRFSFAFFALALLIAGGALILKTPNIFPWPISEELRVLYGWIFLGAMCYFLFAVYKPTWGNAQGPLMGFLAYDLVLIVPFLQHFATVIPEQRISLIIYVAVLLYSGALAVYFLFINRETRFGSVAQA